MLLRKETYDALMHEQKKDLSLAHHRANVNKKIKVHANGFKKVCPKCGGRKVRDAKRCTRCRLVDPESYDGNGRWKREND